MPEELKKAKLPIFDGEMRKSEDTEAWLLGMKKFFIIYNYSENLKENIATYNIKGKEFKHLVGRIEECKGCQRRGVLLKGVEDYFRSKYLSERYFDN